jgi:hypothetical protein
MPRKSTKSGAQAPEPSIEGVDTPPMPSITQILEDAASKGKPEGFAAKGKKIGRPTVFTQQVADIICIRISEGESLKSITQDEEMPDRATVYRWLAADPAFCDMYTRAREDQADTLADEIIAIADEQPEIIPVTDKRTGELIEHKLDGAFLQWQKNRIDARKWTAMKLKPKKYGDRQILAGDSEAPLEVQKDAMTIVAAAVKNLELKRQTVNEE